MNLHYDTLPKVRFPVMCHKPEMTVLRQFRRLPKGHRRGMAGRNEYTAEIQS
jgi:hypothetical protein